MLTYSIKNSFVSSYSLHFLMVELRISHYGNSEKMTFQTEGLIFQGKMRVMPLEIIPSYSFQNISSNKGNGQQN